MKEKLKLLCEEIEGLETVEVSHQNWCDMLSGGMRCNCDQSDLFYLQEDIFALKKLASVINKP